MNNQKLEKEFDKKFSGMGSLDLPKGYEVYYLDGIKSDKIKQFISDNYIPKAEVEHLIIQAEAKGAEQAIETFEKVPKPNSTN